MTIYLDVVLIENLCMNYIILFATGYILKLKRKHIRIIISSLIGSVYAILAYMEIMKIYSNMIFKIILSIVMVYIAFAPKTIKEMIKVLLLFYLTSFAFGGTAFALLYLIKPEEILIRNGVLIGTYPLRTDRDRLCDLLRAKTIFIDETKETCLSRAKTEEWKNYIEEWFNTYVE